VRAQRQYYTRCTVLGFAPAPLYRLRWYIYLGRVKTSITLPKELLSRLDRVDKNRSALLERAAEAYLARLEREQRDRRDVGIINRNAGRLNSEAEDTLGYQQLP
jgi:predicted transcriptional regulator